MTATASSLDVLLLERPLVCWTPQSMCSMWVNISDCTQISCAWRLQTDSQCTATAWRDISPPPPHALCGCVLVVSLVRVGCYSSSPWPPLLFSSIGRWRLCVTRLRVPVSSRCWHWRLVCGSTPRREVRLFPVLLWEIETARRDQRPAGESLCRILPVDVLICENDWTGYHFLPFFTSNYIHWLFVIELNSIKFIILIVIPAQKHFILLFWAVAMCVSPVYVRDQSFDISDPSSWKIQNTSSDSWKCNDVTHNLLKSTVWPAEIMWK